MKYIRTKDGRIIDTNNYEIKREIYENGELKFYEFWTTPFTDRQVIQLYANEIVKQADTIEELCDEFDIIVPAGICCFGIYHIRYEGWGDFKRACRDFKEKMVMIIDIMKYLVLMVLSGLKKDLFMLLK